jgi:molybdate transport system ATP-binding protein
LSLLALAIKQQLKNFALDVALTLSGEDGNVLVLFGPSGSGKTLTLHAIAGITDPDSGFISIAGRTVFDSQAKLKVKLSDRKVGYLPQNYALFPHLTVFDNIAFGLFKWEKAAAVQRVQELLKLMQLEGFEKRYPRQLSGGQQQRVAFARALAPNPAILLLDEPFSALDAAIRTELRRNLALISREIKLPVVFITHDLEEAYMLADRIAVFDKGAVLQYGGRETVFYRPADKKVAHLVGIRNLWDGRILEANPPNRAVLVRTTLFDIWAEIPAGKPIPPTDSRVTVCVRPEQIRLVEADTPVNSYKVKLRREMARGTLDTLFFSFGANLEPDLEVEITAQQRYNLNFAAKEEWQITIPPPLVHLLY